jgi:hypothetical protein
MQAQTIFRTTHHANYTCFGNALTQSNQLSPRAYRILTYLLSLPDKWQLRVKHLMNHFGFGRDSTYNALKELRRLGYATLKRGRRSSSWFIYDQPQTEGTDTQPHVEIVTEATTEAAYKIPETKISTFQTTLKSTYTSCLKIKDTTTAPDQVPESWEPIKPIVVASIEEITHTTPIVNHEIQQTTLAALPVEIPQPEAKVLPAGDNALPDNGLTPDPLIIEEIERLPLEPKQKKVAQQTLSNLSLPEVKAIIAVYVRALTLGNITNPIGYLVGLKKACINGSLSPVAANNQLTLAQRIEKQERERIEASERGKISNDEWAKSMIERLGADALKYMPWYNPLNQ